MAKTVHLGTGAFVAGVLVAVGMLVLMLVVVDARPAEATFPGKNGKIAYTRAYSTGIDSIYTMNPDGSGDTYVAKGLHPSYSPDGQRIAFAQDDGTNYQIFTINPDRTGKFQVTNNGKDDFNPSYSPDGQKIAYDSGTDETYYSIFTVNAGGGNPVEIFDNGKDNDDPSYSPDGQKIAYVGYDGNDYEIYTINADGTGRFQLTDNTTIDGAPDWSPDGKNIAYWSCTDISPSSPCRADIYTINPDGRNRTPIIRRTAYGETDPSYSPDGQRIAFAANRPGLAHNDPSADYEIYTINADGSGTYQQLTNNAFYDITPSWGSAP